METEQIKLKVIGNMILVEPDKDQENKTKSGIILTEGVSDKYKYGTVRKLGTGVLLPSGLRTEFNVRIGEKIIYKELAGYPIKDPSSQIEYIELVESDILAVIEE